MINKPNLVGGFKHFSIIYGISYFPLAFTFFKMVGTTNRYIYHILYILYHISIKLDTQQYTMEYSQQYYMKYSFLYYIYIYISYYIYIHHLIYHVLYILYYTQQVFCFADKQCFAHLLGATFFSGRQRNFVELVDCLIGKEGDAAMVGVVF